MVDVSLNESRSKSYDAKLNEQTGVGGSSGRVGSSDDDQTKIIITSFAPIPDANRQESQLAQTRPKSYQLPATDSPNDSQHRQLSLLWPNGRNNLPLIVFLPKVVRKTYWECKKIGGLYFFHRKMYAHW
jgi:hypothetical protein